MHFDPARATIYLSSKKQVIKMNEAVRINKYMPIALIYFFFNGFLLPIGLLYTTLLSPLFLLWLYKYPSFKYLKWFFIFTIPFAIFHFILGVESVYYLRSYLLLFSVFIFSLAFYQFLIVCKSLGSIYSRLTLVNFVFTIIAIITLLIPFLRDILWTDSRISSGIEGVDRLKLFTYEPSYYSTILAPIALYYYLKALLNKLRNPTLMLFMISVPLLLSFSFGVILAMIFAMLLLLLTHVSSFFARKMVAIYILVGILIIMIVLIVLLFLFPDNVFFLRLLNVLEGKDTSFRGRTYDAFYLGWNIAEMKSIFWGSGLGQTKVLGLDLWQTYYRERFNINSIAISNAVGDTLAIFGIFGLFIRFGLQIFLFFKTRVYENYYRFLLFLFIFIYQFTGSFIYNIAEYVIWILAFSNVFPELDKKKSPAKSNQ